MASVLGTLTAMAGSTLWLQIGGGIGGPTEHRGQKYRCNSSTATSLTMVSCKPCSLPTTHCSRKSHPGGRGGLLPQPSQRLRTFSRIIGPTAKPACRKYWERKLELPVNCKRQRLIR